LKNWYCSYIQIPRFSGILMNDLENFLVANAKETTFDHVCRVAETNLIIAEKFNLDKEICMVSGLLHDVSAIIHPADMLLYAQENNYEIDESEKRFPFLLHQRLSRVIAKELFGIGDPQILSAIECHSTLKNHATFYDMSLFIADKLSWDKEGMPPYYDIVTGEMNTSLESASLAYMNYIVDKNMILFPHKWFIEGKKSLESSKSSQTKKLNEWR
jgi:predicted HD superfamily hydrolase involved in NAD metabolism